MSEVPFYMTRAGRKFYDHTVPELVEQLTRLNAMLARIAERLEPPEGDADAPQPNCGRRPS